MAELISTAIGRVVPFYVGEWLADTTYEKLDNVLYNGSTYIALRTVPSTIGVPSDYPTYWQLIARKGDTGGVGTVMATATSSETAYASATVDGDDPSAMNFSFEFGLPKGDPGNPAAITSVTASANQLGYDEAPTANVTVGGEPTAATLAFTFGIPGAAGGVSKVDGVNPQQGNVPLTAVQYGRSQSLDSTQKTQALNNIGAQPAGNYIVDPNASTNQFLQFNNEGNWVGTTINLVPSGSSADVNKYLRKTANGMLWADVQSLPSGGAEGMPLIKSSIDDYAVTWGSVISNSDIDAIIEI